MASISGTSADDILIPTSGSDFIGGGAGIDTVAYNQSWGNYSFAFIYKFENEFRGVVFGASGFDYLASIENISFNGVVLSFTPNTLSFNVYSSTINVDNPAAQTLIEASQNYGFVAQIKFGLGFSLTPYLSKNTLSRWRTQMRETV